ncbi:hypothetical protein KA005_25920 [bacterium]|nr:hypothetical protein [bacterium]
MFKKMFCLGLALFLIYIGIIHIYTAEQMTVQEYIADKWSNVTQFEKNEYPIDWVCVEISNSYMNENPEWNVVGIFIWGESKAHAANYKIEDERFYVHDETWGYEYEFDDWKNMSLHLYCDGNEITKGFHIVYPNIGNY